LFESVLCNRCRQSTRGLSVQCEFLKKDDKFVAEFYANFKFLCLHMYFFCMKILDQSLFEQKSAGPVSQHSSWPSSQKLKSQCVFFLQHGFFKEKLHAKFRTHNFHLSFQEKYPSTYSCQGRSTQVTK
jgi:hypothetical protein